MKFDFVSFIVEFVAKIEFDSTVTDPLQKNIVQVLAAVLVIEADRFRFQGLTDANKLPANLFIVVHTMFSNLNESLPYVWFTFRL